MNQSNQITAVPLRQANPLPAAHLTVVPGAQSEFPAPFTAGWARRLAKAVGMPPAEIPHFTAWVCSFQESLAPSRPPLRVVQ